MTLAVRHLTTAELEAGLAEILRSPKDAGVLEMIVRRPVVGERKMLNEGRLDHAEGLVGDSWRERLGDRTPDPDVQLTLMNLALPRSSRRIRAAGRWRVTSCMSTWT